MGMKETREGARKVKNLEEGSEPLQRSVIETISCVCVYQSVKGFGQSPCLRSFTKKGHITDSMNISSCYYNAHSLFNFSHVWAESHHLCVLYTEKHTCLLQKHVIRQRFSFFFLTQHTFCTGSLVFTAQPISPRKSPSPYVDCVFVRHFNLMNSCL